MQGTPLSGVSHNQSRNKAVAVIAHVFDFCAGKISVRAVQCGNRIPQRLFQIGRRIEQAGSLYAAGLFQISSHFPFQLRVIRAERNHCCQMRPRRITQNTDPLRVNMKHGSIGLQKTDHRLAVMDTGRENRLTGQAIVRANDGIALLCQADKIPAVNRLLGGLFIFAPHPAAAEIINDAGARLLLFRGLVNIQFQIIRPAIVQCDLCINHICKTG